VRRLREFNLALLGKWFWSLYVYRVELRFKVLVVKYGIKEGHIRRDEVRSQCGGRIYVRLAKGCQVPWKVGLNMGWVTLWGDVETISFWSDPCWREGPLHQHSQTL
jgi:hypothetical protein